MLALEQVLKRKLVSSITDMARSKRKSGKESRPLVLKRNTKLQYKAQACTVFLAQKLYLRHFKIITIPPRPYHVGLFES